MHESDPPEFQKIPSNSPRVKKGHIVFWQFVITLDVNRVFGLFSESMSIKIFDPTDILKEIDNENNE